MTATAPKPPILIDDDPTGFRLSPELIANFLNPWEIYFEPAHDNRQLTRGDQSLAADFFDTLYQADPDPWRFETSDYEAAKYAATIAALPQTTLPLGL